MSNAIAIICFSLSVIAPMIGVVIEYRQTRAHGPVAIVPTLPYAGAGSLFVVAGLLQLPYSIPWWAYPLSFLATVSLFGYAICRATARRTNQSSNEVADHSTATNHTP